MRTGFASAFAVCIASMFASSESQSAPIIYNVDFTVSFGGETGTATGAIETDGTIVDGVTPLTSANIIGYGLSVTLSGVTSSTGGIVTI